MYHNIVMSFEDKKVTYLVWYFQLYVAASKRMQSVEFGRFCLFVLIVQETVLIWGAVKHRHTQLITKPCCSLAGPHNTTSFVAALSVRYYCIQNVQ